MVILIPQLCEKLASILIEVNIRQFSNHIHEDLNVLTTVNSRKMYQIFFFFWRLQYNPTSFFFSLFTRLASYKLYLSDSLATRILLAVYVLLKKDAQLWAEAWAMGTRRFVAAPRHCLPKDSRKLGHVVEICQFLTWVSQETP